MQIVRVPTPPAGDAEPHPLVVAACVVDRLIGVDEFGHDDFSDSPRAVTVGLAGSDYGRRFMWVALPDGVDPDACPPDAALGFATIRLPDQEDRAKALVFVGTRPDARSRGVGRALLEALAAVAVAEGRTTWLGWSFNPGPSATGPDAVPARSGAGAIDGRRPANRWFLAEGFTLEQCERPSTLTLGEALYRRADALQADAAASAGPDHDLLSWSDATPAEHVDDLAWLISRMSTDVPMADLGYEEEVWDADRVRDNEERMRQAGVHWLLTAARHRPSGRLVAFTRFVWPDHNPAALWQDETLVLAGHRGRRLGLLVKAANLVRLPAANPDARRVHTWNAAENRWMLAINDALGFEPVGLEGEWRKLL